MVATKLIGVFLCLLGTTVIATTRSPRLSGPEFCNLQRLTTNQPSNSFEFEGGSIETYWDVNDEQYQCLGVDPSRITIQQNSLLLPTYQPFPRLVFIEQGEGILGVQLPGCPETFDTGVEYDQQQQQQQKQQQKQQQPRRMGEQEQEQERVQGDSHQKVHRIRQGDIIAIPNGAVHWIYNDRNQELVAIVADDINNPSNQLDMQTGNFFLAGGVSAQHIQGQQQAAGKKQQRSPARKQQQQQQDQEKENIYSGFDTELLAEAFNSDPQIVSALQQSSDRGLIVKVQQPMEFVTPDEEQQQTQPRRSGEGRSANGVEEKICSSKIFFNLDNQREADIFSRQAGKLNLVNEHKLPILSYLDLSAEKGNLLPNALFSPYWTVNSHTIIYVLSGDAQVEVVSNNGEAVLNEQVSRGDIYAVPQFFATTAKAGRNGFEWVAFKTNKSPMKTPVAGYTSVFRAMPLDVITNSYDVSPSQAQNLKTNRETESLLFSPQNTF